MPLFELQFEADKAVRSVFTAPRRPPDFLSLDPLVGYGRVLGLASVISVERARPQKHQSNSLVRQCHGGFLDIGW
jgi:hypothetical protein